MTRIFIRGKCHSLIDNMSCAALSPASYPSYLVIFRALLWEGCKILIWPIASIVVWGWIPVSLYLLKSMARKRAEINAKYTFNQMYCKIKYRWCDNWVECSTSRIICQIMLEKTRKKQGHLTCDFRVTRKANLVFRVGTRTVKAAQKSDKLRNELVLPLISKVFRFSPFADQEKEISTSLRLHNSIICVCSWISSLVSVEVRLLRVYNENIIMVTHGNNSYLFLVLGIWAISIAREERVLSPI